MEPDTDALLAQAKALMETIVQNAANGRHEHERAMLAQVDELVDKYCLTLGISQAKLDQAGWDAERRVRRQVRIEAIHQSATPEELRERLMELDKWHPPR